MQINEECCGGGYGRGKLGKLVGDSVHQELMMTVTLGNSRCCVPGRARRCRGRAAGAGAPAALHGQLAVQTAARALADGFMVEFKRSSNASEFISLWVKRCSNSCYEDP